MIEKLLSRLDDQKGDTDKKKQKKAIKVKKETPEVKMKEAPKPS